MPKFVPKEIPSQRPTLTLDSLRRTIQMNENTIANFEKNARKNIIKPELQIGEDEGFASFEDNFPGDVAMLAIIDQLQAANQSLRDKARKEFGEII